MICGVCGAAFSVLPPDGDTLVYNAATDTWEILPADPEGDE